MGIKLFKNLFGKGKESTKPKKNSRKKQLKRALAQRRKIRKRLLKRR
jgi:hypothetical protein